MAQVSLKNVSGAAPQGGSAVHSFTLEVRDRELLVIAGPQGCGASALLRMIAGLDPVASGEIVIGNKGVTDLAPKLRDLSMVFPQGALFPHWTVAQNIAFGLKGEHFPKSETGKRVRQAGEAAGLGEGFELRPGALSPMDALRVAWARAIIRQPKVILMDDPISALPPELRSQARAELVKLQERLQSTVIYATHDPLTAMTLGHRTALVEAGELRQCDAPAEIYRRPANRFAAGFLGRMNFLRGRLRAAPAGFLYKENAGTVELALPEGPGLRDCLRDYVGKEVILGVRPEAILPTTAGDGNRRTATGQAVVDSIEATGTEVLYTVQTGAHTLLVRREGGELQAGVGRRMPFDILPESVHLFDAETSARIS